MSYTIQQVISDVQRRFPDAPSASCLVWVNQIHREILATIPELRRDVLSQNVTAGVAEYNIVEPVFQVVQAEYWTSATTVIKLEATTVETLNEVEPGWRAETGVPSQFYLTSNQQSGNSEVIGLFPIPNASTSGSYPMVKMYISELEASDLVLGSPCLPTLSSSQVYVEGLSFMVAQAIRKDEAAAYLSSYQSQLKAQELYVATRNSSQDDPYVANSRSKG